MLVSVSEVCPGQRSPICSRGSLQAALAPEVGGGVVTSCLNEEEVTTVPGWLLEISG